MPGNHQNEKSYRRIKLHSKNMRVDRHTCWPAQFQELGRPNANFKADIKPGLPGITNHRLLAQTAAGGFLHFGDNAIKIECGRFLPRWELFERLKLLGR